MISGAAAEISAGPVWRKEGGRALLAVIRTPGALLEGRAGVGLGWLVGPAEMGGVHGTEERGGGWSRGISGAGRKEKLTRWGRFVSGGASESGRRSEASGVRPAGAG